MVQTCTWNANMHMYQHNKVVKMARQIKGTNPGKMD